MIYKPEHVNDPDSGALISAQGLPGDLADSQEMAARVLGAVGLWHPAVPEVAVESLARELAGDEGCFSAGQVAILQECGIRTVIVDPHRHRRSAKSGQRGPREFDASATCGAEPARQGVVAAPRGISGAKFW